MIVERQIVLGTAASPVRAVIAMRVLEPRPGRVRAWIAVMLVRLAGRIAGMRVRVEPGNPRLT